MEHYYRFAGVEVSVSMPEEIFYREERHLAPFAVESTFDPHRFTFEVVDALASPGGSLLATEPGVRIYSNGDIRVRCIGTGEDAYLRAEHRGREHHVQVRADAVPGWITTKTVLNALDAAHLIAQGGGFVFHCSYIDWNGRAILFTAPSETGKSTQAELWQSLRGAQIINGDRAAVRIVGGKAMAEGIPYAGSSSHCLNRSLPIAAIVYLGQGSVTSIRRMRGYEAFARIWEGCSVSTWDREDVAQVSETVRALAQLVPVYHLPCTPDESAVIALENALESR